MSKGELIPMEKGCDLSGRDLVNQLLGQAQAFHAAGNLLQTFGVSKLATVKENKLYQQLAGQKTPNGLELKGTWVEFCGLLGMSDEKANQDIANLQAFGEAALEQMQLVGIGYRDLRQFRRLPQSERDALTDAAQSGDKGRLMELAEDLLARNTKLAAEVADVEAQADKRSKRLEAELEHRDAVIQKLKKKDVQRDFDPLTHMVRDECLAYQAGVEINLQSLAALFDEVVADDPQAPEWTLRLEQIWFATHAATARATALLDKVRSTMPRQMPQQAATPNMLTPDEVMHWTLEWETMVSQAKVAAATRADLRAQEGPRGVGRPKGAKTGAKLDGKAYKA